MAQARAPLAPSDLASARALKSVRAAGRVLVCEGSTFDLADAFASVRVRCIGPASLAEGDLVTVSGRWTGKALTDARIVERRPHQPPRADGEFARLALSPVGRNLRARSRAYALVRAYFRQQKFVEVDTPVRVPAPGVDFHIDAVAAEGGYLVSSPEYQMKRLLVGGMPRIFQLGRASREDECGPLHEPEFTMLEWYRAFAGQEDVIRDTEQIVARVVTALAGKPRVLGPGDRPIDVRPPFPRLTVRDAFRRHAGVEDAAALAESDEDRYFQLWVDRVQPALAAESRPLFLCAYPASEAALARRSPDDPSVAERFELFLGGVELCNGYGELTDVAEQRARVVADRERRKRAKRPVYPIDEKFLNALSEGMPPSGGNALGLDRLILLAVGARAIGEVVAFPRDRL